MSGGWKIFYRSTLSRRIGAFCSAVLLAAISLNTGGPARAAETDPAYDINIPSRSMPDALVALAMQANVSIGGIDPARCGKSTAVHGRMKAERALRLMLNGSRCEARRFNASTFRLEMALPASPKPLGAVRMPEAPIDEILVMRRPQLITGTTRPISVIPGKVLAEDDLDLTNLAQRVPGMAVTNLGPGRDKILLRGVSDSVLTGRTQSTVGLYLDDSPITYNAPDPDLLLVDMARVEVLKGPQGALYGQGSLSGVVRLVTNKPRIDAYESNISAGMGVTEGGQTSWRTTAMLNLPLAGNRLGLRTVVYEDKSGGFIKDDVAGKKATNNTERLGGRIALIWPVTNQFSLTATAIAQKLDSENSQYVSGQMGPYRRALTVAEPHDNAFADLSIDIVGEIPIGSMKASLNHLHHSLSTGYDAQPLQRLVSIPNSGVLFYDEDQSISLSTADISFLSPSGQKLRWLGGVFWAESEDHFDPHLVDVFTRNRLYDEARTDRIADIAVFGYLAYDFTPHVTGSIGLRSTRTHHETDSLIENVHLTGNAPSGQINGHLASGHLAHNFLINYHPRPGFALYVQAADGFRTGGFNTTTQLVTAIPNVYLGDALSSFEAGIKYSTPGNRIRLSLVNFNITWRDIQSDQLRSTGLPIVANIGDGVNSGTELEADWVVSRRLALHVAAQVNNPRLRKPNPSFSRDKDGGMPFIARKSLSLSADWNQKVLRHRVENSLTLSYRSASPLNYGPLRTVQMDPYTNVDMSSFVNFGKMRIGARLNNVTGVKSNSFAYGNPFSLEGSSQITPLRPRTLWLSISRRY